MCWLDHFVLQKKKVFYQVTIIIGNLFDILSEWLKFVILKSNNLTPAHNLFDIIDIFWIDYMMDIFEFFVIALGASYYHYPNSINIIQKS